MRAQMISTPSFLLFPSQPITLGRPLSGLHSTVLLTSKPTFLFSPLPRILSLSFLHLAILYSSFPFFLLSFNLYALRHSYVCAKWSKWYDLCFCGAFGLPGVADKKENYINMWNPNYHKFNERREKIHLSKDTWLIEWKSWDMNSCQPVSSNSGLNQNTKYSIFNN